MIVRQSTGLDLTKEARRSLRAKPKLLASLAIDHHRKVFGDCSFPGPFQSWPEIIGTRDVNALTAESFCDLVVADVFLEQMDRRAVNFVSLRVPCTPSIVI